MENLGEDRQPLDRESNYESSEDIEGLLTSKSSYSMAVLLNIQMPEQRAKGFIFQK
jgi:hypothetical protein